MADSGNAEFVANEVLKESPPPQEVPEASTTPEVDADGKVRKARTTVILREVDPAATEDEILALFAQTEYKVVSARMDVQYTWFVNMETEDMAKQAVVYLGQQTLHGKPVKARVKSEGGTTLRTSAPSWQPPMQTLLMAQQANMYGAQGGFQVPGQNYANWGSGKPASINRPPPGGVFRKMTQAAAHGAEAGMEGGVPQAGEGLEMGEVVQQSHGQDAGNQQHGGGGRGPRRGGGNQNRSGTDRRGGNRRQGFQGQAAPSKPASFQPQDFPTLGGAKQSPVPEPTPVAAVAPPAQEAPANSWAARAKTAADAPAPAPAPQQQKKKEASAQPDSATKGTRKDSANPVPMTEKATVVIPPQSVSLEEAKVPVRSVPQQKAVEAAPDTASNAAEIKRRGWEKPGLPQPKKETPAPTSPPAAPVSDVKPASSQSEGEIRSSKDAKDTQVDKREAKKQSGAKKSGSREKGEKEANGHAPQPSPIVPLSWGTKSFAQVIKEKAASPTPAPAPAAAASVPSTDNLTIASLKNNESWGDVEDDEPSASGADSANGRTAAGRTAAAKTGLVNLEKLRQSSENSNDWRRDAAARRKNEEQSRSTGPVSRRSNGASS